MPAANLSRFPLPPAAPVRPPSCSETSFHINTTAGLVEEMDRLGESGLLRYTRFAGRLVPDNYQPLNPQGWWDDEHWRRFGYHIAPFETSEKFGRAMHAHAGLAFIYIQPACLWSGAQMSQDFRVAHVDWLSGKNVDRTLDFTNPAAQAYRRITFGALRGVIDRLMVDYCDHLWLSEAAQGGFVDPHATGTAFYRAFFPDREGRFGSRLLAARAQPRTA